MSKILSRDNFINEVYTKRYSNNVNEGFFEFLKGLLKKQGWDDVKCSNEMIKSKLEELDNKLNGFFENDTCIIKKLDKTLSTDKLKSDLINLTLSKTSTNVEFKVYSRAGVLQKGNLQKISLYAKKLVESGIEESLSGKINALPIETRFCEVCPYYELCKFNIEFGEFRESVTSVKENNLVEIVENS